jgi:NTE family protein
MFLEMTYFASPYQTNPLNLNPLKDLMTRAINFERVRQQTIVKLYLSATNVQTAKVKIFEGKELDVPRLLASTCLPLLMQAIEVDGEFYRDGSYAGNPAIFPLLYNCTTPDILLVHITPAERPGVPTTSPGIMNRMQEISFNTSLIREMRTIAYLNKQIDDGKMDGTRRMLVHLIEAEDLIRSFSWSSRLNTDWNFLVHLYNLGRQRADGGWRSISTVSAAIQRSISTRSIFDRGAPLTLSGLSLILRLAFSPAFCWLPVSLA